MRHFTALISALHAKQLKIENIWGHNNNKNQERTWKVMYLGFFMNNTLFYTYLGMVKNTYTV